MIFFYYIENDGKRESTVFVLGDGYLFLLKIRIIFYLTVIFLLFLAYKSHKCMLVFYLMLQINLG